MIEEKIIEFVLSIPIEKWNRLEVKINEVEISLCEDAIRINGKTINIPKELCEKYSKLKNVLKEKQKEIVKKESAVFLERLYEILTCTHPKFIMMYYASPNKELRCKECNVAKKEL